jgi:hypothetical protein
VTALGPERLAEAAQHYASGHERRQQAEHEDRGLAILS